MMNPVLPGAPWLVAHRVMLGVNQPYKLTLNSNDYVLWQNAEGEIFALENVCPHLQAPLSDGWICQQGNAIACPFHALEFDGQGRLYQDGNKNKSVQPVAKPLDLILQSNLIWTYGGHDPRLPIPDLIPRLTAGFQFLGVTGVKSIEADFLRSLLINYDFNHPPGTHREPFKIRSSRIQSYESNGYTAKVVQESLLADHTWREVLHNPILMIAPKRNVNHFEYAFPTITSIAADVPLGRIVQLFMLYPEQENRTKTFVLVYAQPHNSLLLNWFKSQILKAIELVVEQDTGILETLYPRQKPRIKLPQEEILVDVEQLYQSWESQ